MKEKNKKLSKKKDEATSSSDQPEPAKGYRIRKFPNLQFIVSDVTKREYYQIFNQKTIQALKGKEIVFNQQEYSTFTLKQIFLNLRRINIQRLILNYTLNRKILKQIQHIDFPSLKQLSLNSNILSNVEALGYLKMPRLQYKIVLYDIVINQIQFLAYISSTKLSQLQTLKKNLVLQIE